MFRHLLLLHPQTGFVRPLQEYLSLALRHCPGPYISNSRSHPARTTKRLQFLHSWIRRLHYLATRVLLASMNATKAENAALFKEHLDAVLAFDLDSRPDLKPENAAEQRKARELLEELDVYFPDYEPPAETEAAPAAEEE